jgi:hypothetical protein
MASKQIAVQINNITEDVAIRAGEFFLLPENQVPPVIESDISRNVIQTTWIDGYIDGLPSYKTLEPINGTITVLKGTAVEFSVIVSDPSIINPVTLGDDIELQYVWKKNEEDIVGINALENGKGISGIAISTEKSTEEATGYYECHISNRYGTVVSERLKVVIVNPLKHPMLFTNILKNGSSATGWEADEGIITRTFIDNYPQANGCGSLPSLRYWDYGRRFNTVTNEWEEKTNSLGNIIEANKKKAPRFPSAKQDFGFYQGALDASLYNVFKIWRSKNPQWYSMNSADLPPIANQTIIPDWLNWQLRNFPPALTSNEDVDTFHQKCGAFYPGLNWIDKYNNNNPNTSLVGEAADSMLTYISRDKIKFEKDGGVATVTCTQTVDLNEISPLIDGKVLGIEKMAAQFFGYAGAGITGYKIKAKSYDKDGISGTKEHNWYILNPEDFWEHLKTNTYLNVDGNRLQIVPFTAIEIIPLMEDETDIELTMQGTEGDDLITYKLNTPDVQDIFAVKEKAYLPLTWYPIFELMSAYHCDIKVFGQTYATTRSLKPLMSPTTSKLEKALLRTDYSIMWLNGIDKVFEKYHSLQLLAHTVAKKEQLTQAYQARDLISQEKNEAKKAFTDTRERVRQELAQSGAFPSEGFPSEGTLLKNEEYIAAKNVYDLAKKQLLEQQEAYTLLVTQYEPYEVLMKVWGNNTLAHTATTNATSSELAAMALDLREKYKKSYNSVVAFLALQPSNVRTQATIDTPLSVVNSRLGDWIVKTSAYLSIDQQTANPMLASDPINWNPTTFFQSIYRLAYNIGGTYPKNKINAIFLNKQVWWNTTPTTTTGTYTDSFGNTQTRNVQVKAGIPLNLKKLDEQFATLATVIAGGSLPYPIHLFDQIIASGFYVTNPDKLQAIYETIQTFWAKQLEISGKQLVIQEQEELQQLKSDVNNLLDKRALELGQSIYTSVESQIISEQTLIETELGEDYLKLDTPISGVLYDADEEYTNTKREYKNRRLTAEQRLWPDRYDYDIFWGRNQKKNWNGRRNAYNQEIATITALDQELDVAHFQNSKSNFLKNALKITSVSEDAMLELTNLYPEGQFPDKKTKMLYIQNLATVGYGVIEFIKSNEVVPMNPLQLKKLLQFRINLTGPAISQGIALRMYYTQFLTKEKRTAIEVNYEKLKKELPINIANSRANAIAQARASFIEDKNNRVDILKEFPKSIINKFENVETVVDKKKLAARLVQQIQEAMQQPGYVELVQAANTQIQQSEEELRNIKKENLTDKKDKLVFKAPTEFPLNSPPILPDYPQGIKRLQAYTNHRREVVTAWKDRQRSRDNRQLAQEAVILKQKNIIALANSSRLPVTLYTRAVDVYEDLPNNEQAEVNGWGSTVDTRSTSKGLLGWEEENHNSTIRDLENRRASAEGRIWWDRYDWKMGWGQKHKKHWRERRDAWYAEVNYIHQLVADEIERYRSTDYYKDVYGSQGPPGNPAGVGGSDHTYHFNSNAAFFAKKVQFSTAFPTEPGPWDQLSTVPKTRQKKAIKDPGAAAMFAVGDTVLIPKNTRYIKTKIIFRHTGEAIYDTDTETRNWTKEEIYRTDFDFENPTSTPLEEYGFPRCGVTMAKLLILTQTERLTPQVTSYYIPPAGYTAVGLRKKALYSTINNTSKFADFGYSLIQPETPEQFSGINLQDEAAMISQYQASLFVAQPAAEDVEGAMSEAEIIAYGDFISDVEAEATDYEDGTEVPTEETASGLDEDSDGVLDEDQQPTNPINNSEETDNNDSEETNTSPGIY